MKNFKPSKELIQTAKNVIAFQSAFDITKPIVEGIKQDVINEKQYIADQNNKSVQRRGLKVITNPFHDFFLTEEDSKDYYKELNNRYRDAGFEVEINCCPLANIEYKLTQAQRKLTEGLEELTGITWNDLTCSAKFKENIERYMSIQLRYLANWF